MKRVFVSINMTICLLALPGYASAGALDSGVTRTLRDSGLKSATSVTVWNPETGDSIFTWNADHPKSPASNQKLYTAAASLDAYGANHVFETQVLMKGVLADDGTYRGDIYLRGDGDPTLSTREFSRRVYGSRGGSIEELAREVEQTGIKSFKGRLIVDEGKFDRRRFVGSWPSRFRYFECASLSAISVNQGYFGSTMFGPTTRDQAAWAGASLMQELKKQGIKVRGAKVTKGSTPEDAEVVADTASMPLRKIISFMNHHSDNFMAEILLKNIGAASDGVGTTSGGAKAVVRMLTSRDIPVDSVVISDGSGLSSANRTTSRGIAQLLFRMDNDADLGEAFERSLAVSGQDGTLRKRLAKRPFKGQVRAKTGTLRSSSALSGYAYARSGSRFGFSVVTWNDNQAVNANNARGMQDAIARLLVKRG